ncbi:DUF6069 family protein [Kribbella sp. NBC_00382]|uniref:DUF6069 family protein n=1 Tax=Kribbella sp. NBC_00382 TaxID=2975967 RepID=UPI002E23FBF9
MTNTPEATAPTPTTTNLSTATDRTTKSGRTNANAPGSTTTPGNTNAAGTPAPTARPTRVEGRSRLAVAGSVTVVAVAWWAVLTQAFNITLAAKQGSTIHIGAPSVLVASLAISLAAWALLAVLEHNTPAARKAWTITATIACALSLTSPLTAGIGIGAKLGLASLHLVVGSLIILGLRRTALSTEARCTPTA